TCSSPRRAISSSLLSWARVARASASDMGGPRAWVSINAGPVCQIGGSVYVECSRTLHPRPYRGEFVQHHEVGRYLDQEGMGLGGVCSRVREAPRVLAVEAFEGAGFFLGRKAQADLLPGHGGALLPQAVGGEQLSYRLPAEAALVATDRI